MSALLAFGLSGVKAQPPSAPLRNLFLDPSMIQKSHNVELRVNAPEQREVVVRPDRPWEQLMISFFLTVVDDDGKLRMWYSCRDREQADATGKANLAYAESTDGVNWTKPELGLADYRGSTANNLVGVPSLEGNVYPDPHAVSPDERYLYVTYQKREGIIRYTSPDGLRWTKDEKPLMPFKADSQNVTFWDANINQYVLYLRGWTLDDRQWQNKRRQIVRLTADILSKPLPVTPAGKQRPGVTPVIAGEVPVVLEADSEDPENSDVYNISASPYPPDPRWYVGFPSILQRDRNVSDGTTTVHFVGSKDGVTWHKYDRGVYVGLNAKGAETPNMVFMGTGLVVRGDEIWQYGTELNSRHGDMKARMKRTDGVIYRYVQRIDGFVSLDFNDTEGTCLTQPVKVDGTRLVLNANAANGGALRVGLAKADGTPIPGFGAEDSRPVEIDSTSAAVSWKGGGIESIHAGELRLHFIGKRAKLYSFRFDGAKPSEEAD